MRPKRIKIEVTLDDGSKLTLTISETSRKEKIKKFLDLLDLFTERLSFTSESLENELLEKATTMEKVTYVIYSRFLDSPFTLKQLIEEYERMFDLYLRPNTAATYLSRLVEQGVLRRVGTRGSYRYIVIPPSKRIPVELTSHEPHHNSVGSS